jgi:hypothetical protein
MAAVARGPTSPLAFLRWERRDSYTRKKVQKLGTSLPDNKKKVKEFFAQLMLVFFPVLWIRMVSIRIRIQLFI